MTKLETWLGGVLAIQLLLAAGFLWADRPDFQAGEKQSVLEVNVDTVDKIVISDGEQDATLVRAGEAWQLPEFDGLPATPHQVKQLLQRLDGLAAGWPVATSRASHERFEVADDNFQRHISLYENDTTVGEILVGSSPGIRQVHIRKLGEDAVFTGELPVYDMPAKDVEWLDKTLLAAGELTAMEGPDYKLEKQGGRWQFADATESTVDQEQANKLAEALKTFRIEAPADVAANDLAEDFSISAESDNGSLTYRFLTADDKHYVRRDDHEGVFTMRKFQYDRLAEFDHARLEVKETAEQAPTTSETNAE